MAEPEIEKEAPVGSSVRLVISSAGCLGGGRREVEAAQVGLCSVLTTAGGREEEVSCATGSEARESQRGPVQQPEQEWAGLRPTAVVRGTPAQGCGRLPSSPPWASFCPVSPHSWPGWSVHTGGRDEVSCLFSLQQITREDTPQKVKFIY